jgi:hypothetical protein
MNEEGLQIDRFAGLLMIFLFDFNLLAIHVRRYNQSLINFVI